MLVGLFSHSTKGPFMGAVLQRGLRKGQFSLVLVLACSHRGRQAGRLGRENGDALDTVARNYIVH